MEWSPSGKENYLAGAALGPADHRVGFGLCDGVTCRERAVELELGMPPAAAIRQPTVGLEPLCFGCVKLLRCDLLFASNHRIPSRSMSVRTMTLPLETALLFCETD